MPAPAPPGDHLDAFLKAHAQGPMVPAALYARGEELYRRWSATPPPLPAWGRFLVAMGELAAERLEDPAAASRFFLSALQGADLHGDYQAAVTAGYNQGVLQERRGHETMALAAYRTAAREGFRLGVIAANTLRASSAAVRLHFATYGDLADAALAKQAWFGWLYLRRTSPEQIDDGLRDMLGLQLCALLLPEDDPGRLAELWRRWPPHRLLTPEGWWEDGAPICLEELFAVAGESADRHLADEGADPGAPYRLLQAAAQRQRQV